MDHDNIFEIAFNAKCGKYGDEDLFTDMFAWLLRQDPHLAKHLISNMCEFLPSSVRSIVTQPSFKEYPNDYPDMLIETPQMNIICEHKIGAPLGNRQLERYLSLVVAEEERTEKPHRLLFIARDIVGISPEVLQHASYLKPSSQTHFRWRDIYATTQTLNELQPESPYFSQRTHLLDCMRFLKLAFLVPHSGYGLVAGSETARSNGGATSSMAKPATNVRGKISDEAQPSDKFIQEKAFGEAWLTIDGTESWFATRGFKSEIGSRKELYVSARSDSEITPEMGLKHLHLTPNDGKNLPRNAQFEPPCLKCFVSFTRDGEDVTTRMLGNAPANLEALSLPLAVKAGSNAGAPFQIWLPLSPMLEAPDLSDALRDVTVELYQKIILPAFSVESRKV